MSSPEVFPLLPPAHSFKFIGPTVISIHTTTLTQLHHCSRPCPSCGHFQQRRSEQCAPPCVFSVIAAHFLTLSVLENLRCFDPSKRDRESNKTPTNNRADFKYAFGIEDGSAVDRRKYPNGRISKTPVHGICCSQIRVPPTPERYKQGGGTLTVFGCSKFRERGLSPPRGRGGIFCDQEFPNMAAPGNLIGEVVCIQSLYGLEGCFEQSRFDSQIECINSNLMQGV